MVAGRREIKNPRAHGRKGVQNGRPDFTVRDLARELGVPYAEGRDERRASDEPTAHESAPGSDFKANHTKRLLTELLAKLPIAEDGKDYTDLLAAAGHYAGQQTAYAVSTGSSDSLDKARKAFLLEVEKLWGVGMTDQFKLTPSGPSR